MVEIWLATNFTNRRLQYTRLKSMKSSPPQAPPSIALPKPLCYLCSYMALLSAVLPVVQIILAILLIGAILLQRTGASLGGAFGADNFSSGFHTRRGLEKTLFLASIVLGVLFALTGLVALFGNAIAV